MVITYIVIIKVKEVRETPMVGCMILPVKQPGKVTHCWMWNSFFLIETNAVSNHDFPATKIQQRT